MEGASAIRWKEQLLSDDRLGLMTSGDRNRSEDGDASVIRWKERLWSA